MSEAKSPHHADILILGAGPAGLALGHELKQRGLNFLILERGPAVGESWRCMPTNLKLVSPWKTNSLPGTSKRLHPPNYQMGREEFLAYLRAYANEHRLPIQIETEALAVEKEGNGPFRVRTRRGDFTSRLMVNATGYFSHPFVPEIPGAAQSSISQLHVADFKGADHLRTLLGRPAGTILLVGKRLSAGQTMVELVDAGFEVSLSHRSAIEFGAGPFLWWFAYRIFPWLEWLKMKLHGSTVAANEVRMEGGRARKLIETGTVKTFPAIRAFDGNTVMFENGAAIRPDLVLYATGFLPALQHLAPLGLALNPASGQPALRSLESAAVPGLFFIGLDGARNMQSRFIRGIRNDVVFLAGRLQERGRQPVLL